MWYTGEKSKIRSSREAGRWEREDLGRVPGPLQGLLSPGLLNPHSPGAGGLSSPLERVWRSQTLQSDSRGSQEGRSFSLKATATPGFQPGSRCPKPSHLLSPPHPCAPGKVCRGGAGGEGGGARRPARLQHARRAPHPRAQARPRSPFPFPGYFPFPPCPREEAGTAVTALGQTALKEVIELLLRAVAI